MLSKNGENALDSDPYISTHEIIRAANEKPLSVLIIGKPRCGKSKAAIKLAEALDLVHITIDRWLNNLEAKIAAYEPPEDLEEGEEPPKWLTDFEEEIHKLIRAGQGPNDDQNV